MTLGVADNLKSEQKLRLYTGWLRGDPRVTDCVVLSYVRDNLGAFDACDGLVLTGGHDVDPRLYGGKFPHPAVTDVDTRRDDFERRLLDLALRRGLPVLAICRGLQLANVHLGGTLLPDIEQAGYRSHRSVHGVDVTHGVAVEPATLLAEITGAASGTVNSSHHQCALAAAPGLRVAARSDDGLIEALEPQSPGPFLLLVQWHPERMEEKHKQFAEPIRMRFVTEAQR